MTSAIIGQLPTYAGELGMTATLMLEDQVLDLLALSLATMSDVETARMSSSRTLTRARIMAVINARLTDPTLSAATVASVAGVSTRYANQLLANEGTSIMRLVRDRRLDRCHKALDDPAQKHRSISEIAYGWGFSDMTHFGRSFRSKYGLLPSELRRAARTTSRRFCV
jgi:AraC-like DNA-binding protein